MPSISLININNAQNISISSEFEMFGSSISFKKVTDYTISTVFSNIYNQYGNLISFQEIENLKNSEDYNYFNINGILLKKAKLISFSLQEGNFNKNAIVEIVLQNQENAEDLAALNGYYADYAAGFVEACSFIKNISESIQISTNGSDLDFSKQINITFDSDALLVGLEDPVIYQARVFAKKIFDYDKDNGYSTIPNFYSSASSIRDILNNNIKKIRSENINLITNECSFSESIRCSEIKNTTENYSLDIENSLSADRNGDLSVSENGTIKILNNNFESIKERLINIYNSEKELAKIRMQNLALVNDRNDLKKDIDNKIIIVSENKNFNIFERTITYQLNSSNSTLLNIYNVSSKIDITESNDNGIITKSINGQVQGNSFEKSQRYNQAFDYYTGYLRITGTTGIVSRSETHNLLKGTINYETIISNEKKYNYTGFKMYDIVEGEQNLKTTNTLLDKYAEYFSIDSRIQNSAPYILQRKGIADASKSIQVKAVGYRPSSKDNESLVEVKNKFQRITGQSNGVINQESLDFSWPNDIIYSYNINTLILQSQP